MLSIPQQIFIPGLSISNSKSNYQFQRSQLQSKAQLKEMNKVIDSQANIKSENLQNKSISLNLIEKDSKIPYDMFNKDDKNMNHQIVEGYKSRTKLPD